MAHGKHLQAWKRRIGLRALVAASLTAAAAILALGGASARAADTIYWTNGAGTDVIRSAPLAGGGTMTPAVTGADGFGLTLDPAAGRMYFTDGSSNVIGTAPIGGGAAATLYDQVDGVNDPWGVAIDPAAQRIYWVQADNTIRGAPLDGSGPVDTVYDAGDGVNAPVPLVIDPVAGRLYWAEQPSGADRVATAPASGAGPVQTLYVGAPLNTPYGVAADPAAGRIYWTDFSSGAVRGAPLGGGGTVDTLYSGAAQHASGPVGLAADPASGRLYWGADSLDEIAGAPAAGGGAVDVLYSTAANVDTPYAVAVLRVPVALGAPSISGTRQIGSQLACSEGTWGADFRAANSFRAPASFEYRWQRDGAEIPGATASTYVPTDVGAHTCRITATNAAGSTPSTSAPVEVTSPPAPPALNPNPKITQKPANRGRGKGRKGRRGKKRYVFRFADDIPGVSFLCKLDARPFEPCTSPAIYRGLKPGRHTFQVKSVTADGVESAPQATTFRVPRPGKRR